MKPRGYTSTDDSGKMNADGTLCMHCGACVGTCPQNAMFLHDLSVAADENCNGCRLCIKVCPVGAIELNVKGAKA